MFKQNDIGYSKTNADAIQEDKIYTVNSQWGITNQTALRERIILSTPNAPDPKTVIIRSV